ncbi:hypothetical protein LX32DRAFT_151997 [Colletotrichum zoysiae]|uniref:Uncharacterized protein n=1 Tax=Colletotrichum zoysiae TaxID=1216348 RepID=A0AAD9HVQ9_9PEZI|nr:hypothetical protein LX32DRAFT_151997 [Colletotrichum zoysiae]
MPLVRTIRTVITHATPLLGNRFCSWGQDPLPHRRPRTPSSPPIHLHHRDAAVLLVLLGILPPHRKKPLFPACVSPSSSPSRVSSSCVLFRTCLDSYRPPSRKTALSVGHGLSPPTRCARYSAESATSSQLLEADASCRPGPSLPISHTACMAWLSRRPRLPKFCLLLGPFAKIDTANTFRNAPPVAQDLRGKKMQNCCFCTS